MEVFRDSLIEPYHLNISVFYFLFLIPKISPHKSANDYFALVKQCIEKKEYINEIMGKIVEKYKE